MLTKQAIKMKGNILYVMGLLSLGLIMTGCGKSSKSTGAVGDGQLRGVSWEVNTSCQSLLA